MYRVFWGVAAPKRNTFHVFFELQLVSFSFVHNWKQEKIIPENPAESDPKKGATRMKRREPADKKIEVGKTKKRNVGLTKKANQVVEDPISITQPQFETNGNDASDVRLFANPGKALSEGDKKTRGRRLGIFGFGSRATKLPDAQG